MEDTVQKLFLVIPRVAFELLLEDFPNLDYSEDNLQTTSYTLVCAEESQMEALQAGLMEVGSRNDLAMFAQVLVTRLPSEASLPEGTDYNKFIHEYMWAEIRSREAIKRFEMQDRMAAMFKDSPLAGLIQALGGGSVEIVPMSVAENGEEQGPCDDPNCPFCHPDSAFDDDSPDEEEDYTEPVAEQKDKTFVQGKQGSPDTFFVNGSKSVH